MEVIRVLPTIRLNSCEFSYDLLFRLDGSRRMVAVVTGREALRRLFAAMTEQTFQVDLGIADPPLIDYLSELLVRFVRMDAIFRVRDPRGRRLEDVAEMMMEADQRLARPRRELHRHIGDFTLFWVGVYPEALSRMQAPNSRDHLIDYCEQGKRSYRIASEFAEEPYEEEAPVLRRLSDDFELCSVGLNRVRHEWEKVAHSPIAGRHAERDSDAERN